MEHSSFLLYDSSIFFNKVFLAQLGLDKPFTGGIGSYKLYVMVAFLLQQQRTQIAAMNNNSSSTSSSSSSSSSSSLLSNNKKRNQNENENEYIYQHKEEIKLDAESSSEKVESPDLGYLLVAFLHHFGSQYNLNSDTVVRVRLQAYVPPHTGNTQQSK